MAKVLGVGGIFFKCSDPEATMSWYRDVLGVPLSEYGGADFAHADTAAAFPKGARSIFAPFKSASEYFAPSQSPFMINLIIDDMDAMLEQLEQKGVTLQGTPETYDYGRFAWVLDPNGIKVELWQPSEPAG